ncbi:MAG: hypothetical protein JWP00_4202 [Chloroflexi bacterium]|jgi:hypothetical protein|nr:hypothetical protein [Chloroflexota bacterium]
MISTQDQRLASMTLANCKALAAKLTAANTNPTLTFSERSILEDFGKLFFNYRLDELETLSANYDLSREDLGKLICLLVLEQARTEPIDVQRARDRRSGSERRTSTDRRVNYDPFYGPERRGKDRRKPA